VTAIKETSRVIAINELKSSVFLLRILVVETEMGSDARVRNSFADASIELFLGF